MEVLVAITNCFACIARSFKWGWFLVVPLMASFPYVFVGTKGKESVSLYLLCLFAPYCNFEALQWAVDGSVQASARSHLCGSW